MSASLPAGAGLALAGTAVVAAVLAGAAVLCSQQPTVDRPSPCPPVSGRATAVLLVAVAALATTWAGDQPSTGVPWQAVLLAGVVLPAGRALFKRRRRRRADEGRAERVQEGCEVLAGEVAVGATATDALEAAAVSWPELRTAVSTARLGGAVPEALRDLAARPGAADLRLVAGAWQLSDRTGASLARSLEAVSESLRREAAMRRTIRSELASARATARLVVALPALTLAAGSGLGGAPVRLLLTTPAGLVLAGSGTLLVLLGLWWLEVIAGSVLDRDP